MSGSGTPAQATHGHARGVAAVPAGTGRLLERAAELHAIGDALDAVAVGRSPAALLVEGPAGIGKTALLRHLVADARRRLLRVVPVRALPTSPDEPFGVARELALGVHGLEGHGRPADDPLIGRASGRAVRDPAARLRHALTTLIAATAAEQPLVLVVDDAHWCDTGTAGALSAVAGEADGRLLLVLGLRGPEGAGPGGAQLSALALRPGVARLLPQALTAAATQTIVADRLGSEPVGAFVSASHAATGGNPLLLHAVLAAGAGAGLRPDAKAVERLPQLAAAGVATSVRERMATLPPAATELARAIALLEPEARMDDAAAVAGLDVGDALELLDRLLGAELVAADGTRIVHPVVRDAILSDVGPGQDTALRRRAARRLREAGAPVSRVGALLEPALPLGEPWAAEALADAAAAALADGAPVRAVALLQRAVAEPPPPDERPGVRLQLGEALAAANDPDGVAVLQDALSELRPGHPLHDRALGSLGHTLLLAGRMADAVRLLDGELAAVEPDDAPAGIVLLACDLMSAGQMHPDLARRARAELPRWTARARRGDDEARLLLAHEAFTLGQTGATVLATEVAREALEGGVLIARWGGERLEPIAAAHALMHAEHTDEALATYDALLAAARATESPLSVAGALAWRGQVHLRSGNLRAAEEDAATALAIHAEHGTQLHLPAELAYLAVAQLERGALDAAEETLARSELGAEAGHVLRFLLLDARGRLHHARGRFADAAEHLLRAGEMVLEWGATNPSVLPWRSRAAHALVGAGDREQAATLAAEELRLADAANLRRGRGLALRALAAAAEDPDDAVEQLRAAVDALAPTEDQLSQAHALADLGAVLRRKRAIKDAREPLRLALDLADRSGAVGLATFVREELLAAGARPRRTRTSGFDALTPAERRVAALAAEGRTNREICGELFLSPKTVETHLGRAYRKLSIAGRAELADALAATDDA